jgi:hypothetical protein
LGDEPFQDGDDGVGAGGTVDVHGQRLSGVLVDNVEELETTLVGGLVELEVESPHVVGILGTQQDPLGAARATLLVLAGRWAAQAFFSPQTLELLVVHRPSFPTNHVVGLAPPETGMPASEVRSRRRSFSSATGSGRACLRWVDRCCPTTRQALRSETPNRSRSTTTARWRRSGVTIFPRLTP